MLIQVLVALLVVGLVLWLINAYVPMDAKIKQILNIAVVLIVIIWLLKVTGLLAYLSKIG